MDQFERTSPGGSGGLLRACIPQGCVSELAVGQRRSSPLSCSGSHAEVAIRAAEKPESAMSSAERARLHHLAPLMLAGAEPILAVASKHDVVAAEAPPACEAQVVADISGAAFCKVTMELALKLQPRSPKEGCGTEAVGSVAVNLPSVLRCYVPPAARAVRPRCSGVDSAVAHPEVAPAITGEGSRLEPVLRLVQLEHLDVCASAGAPDAPVAAAWQWQPGVGSETATSSTGSSALAGSWSVSEAPASLSVPVGGAALTACAQARVEMRPDVYRTSFAGRVFSLRIRATFLCNVVADGHMLALAFPLPSALPLAPAPITASAGAEAHADAACRAELAGAAAHATISAHVCVREPACGGGLCDVVSPTHALRLQGLGQAQCTVISSCRPSGRSSAAAGAEPDPSGRADDRCRSALLMLEPVNKALCWDNLNPTPEAVEAVATRLAELRRSNRRSGSTGPIECFDDAIWQLLEPPALRAMSAVPRAGITASIGSAILAATAAPASAAALQSSASAATVSAPAAPSSAALQLLRPDQLPRHIAIVMDGNGRWAKTRGLPRSEGHAAGVEAIHRVIRACRRLGVPFLTLYAFSAQNWGRPRDEVRALMALLIDFVHTDCEELVANGVRLLVNGDESRLPSVARDGLQRLVRASAGNTGLTLVLCLSYGGREEIAGAVAAACADAAAGKLDPRSVGVDTVRAYMPHPCVPDPDLLIRTSGELRISNFLLWQLAYTELHVTPALWPDFSDKHLLEALGAFASRERRFGKTGEQIKAAAAAAACGSAGAAKAASTGSAASTNKIEAARADSTSVSSSGAAAGSNTAGFTVQQLLDGAAEGAGDCAGNDSGIRNPSARRGCGARARAWAQCAYVHGIGAVLSFGSAHGFAAVAPAAGQAAGQAKGLPAAASSKEELASLLASSVLSKDSEADKHAARRHNINSNSSSGVALLPALLLVLVGFISAFVAPPLLRTAIATLSASATVMAALPPALFGPSAWFGAANNGAVERPLAPGALPSKFAAAQAGACEAGGAAGSCSWQTFSDRSSTGASTGGHKLQTTPDAWRVHTTTPHAALAATPQEVTISPAAGAAGACSHSLDDSDISSDATASGGAVTGDGDGTDAATAPGQPFSPSPSSASSSRGAPQVELPVKRTGPRFGAAVPPLRSSRAAAVGLTSGSVDAAHAAADDDDVADHSDDDAAIGAGGWAADVPPSPVVYA